MQNFMGAFFLAFAFFKFLDLRGFADSYRMYDIVARRLPSYGFVYPFIELALGAAYIAGIWPTAVNLATLVVTSVSSIGVIQSVLQKRRIRLRVPRNSVQSAYVNRDSFRRWADDCNGCCIDGHRSLIRTRASIGN